MPRRAVTCRRLWPRRAETSTTLLVRWAVVSVGRSPGTGWPILTVGRVCWLVSQHLKKLSSSLVWMPEFGGTLPQGRGGGGLTPWFDIKVGVQESKHAGSFGLLQALRKYFAFCEMTEGQARILNHGVHTPWTWHRTYLTAFTKVYHSESQMLDNRSCLSYFLSKVPTAGHDDKFNLIHDSRSRKFCHGDIVQLSWFVYIKPGFVSHMSNLMLMLGLVPQMCCQTRLQCLNLICLAEGSQSSMWWKSYEHSLDSV